MPVPPQSAMPLHCLLCNNKPIFSDNSHLLTHLSSKGHLQSHHKAKMNAASDPQVQQNLAAYEAWYIRWGVEDMVRERLAQKEKKAGRRRSTASRRPSGAAPTTGRGGSLPSVSRRGLQTGNALDPSLNQIRYNQSGLTAHLPGLGPGPYPSRPVSPLNPLHHGQIPSGSLYPPLQNWSNTPSSRFDSPMLKQESLGSDEYYDEDDDDSYEDPSHPKAGRRRRISSDSDIPAYEEEEHGVHELGATITDPDKLKGQYWPGMAQFDSATPEDARKRNQKKDASVLVKLEMMSTSIEPTEQVFDAGGVLRKERPITGNVESSDDLIEGESSPEPDRHDRKRIRRPRSALTQKNPNNGRNLRKRDNRQSASSGLRRSRTPYYDDNDDDLTYGSRRPRRSGLSIHRDNSGPDITFNNPAQMSYLTSGLNSYQATGQVTLSQPSPQYQNNTVVPRSHQRQPSWGTLNGTSFRPSHSTGLPSFANMTNFGQYISNSLTNHPFGGMAGNQGFTMGQHRMGTGRLDMNQNHGAQSTGTQHFGMPQASNHVATSGYQPLQLQGYEDHTLDSMLSGLDGFDMTFGNSAGFGGFSQNEANTVTNPLYLGGNRAGAEDDDATISASER